MELLGKYLEILFLAKPKIFAFQFKALIQNNKYKLTFSKNCVKTIYNVFSFVEN